MSSVKSKSRTKPTSDKKRMTREQQAAYPVSTTNAQRAPRSARTKKMIVEMRGGKPYEYYSLGKYVVVAPQVAGVKPIFKYTRVRVKRALEMIADGARIEEVAQKLNNAFIPVEAIREALELARKAFVKAHPPLRRVKRWV